jgi:hypothetical protein
MNLHDVST